jgi:hypothetical protein
MRTLLTILLLLPRAAAAQGIPDVEAEMARRGR